MPKVQFWNKKPGLSCRLIVFITQSVRFWLSWLPAEARQASLTGPNGKKLQKSFGGISFGKYLCGPLKRPVRLRVRTPPFHGGDTSSNLVRATGNRPLDCQGAYFIIQIELRPSNSPWHRNRVHLTNIWDFAYQFNGLSYFLVIHVTELCIMKNNIHGKVVAITGASSGIGEATARMLAAQGAKLVLGARREDRLAALVAQIIKAGGEAVYFVTDIKRRADLVNMVNKACAKYGRLDVMINNAGISYLSRIEELQVEDWEEMIDVNLKGTLYGIAAALPVFKKQGSGHIINIISTSGIRIVPLQGVYAGTKNAVRTIAEALRQESGGQYRVTGISPGFVQTELADNIASKIKDPVARAAIKEKAAKIAISPDAIAGAVAYAISQPDNVDVGDIVIRPSIQD